MQAKILHCRSVSDKNVPWISILTVTLGNLNRYFVSFQLRINI